MQSLCNTILDCLTPLCLGYCTTPLMASSKMNNRMAMVEKAKYVVNQSEGVTV